MLVTRITGNELKTKDALYGAAQNATLVYVTEIPSPSTTKTSNITTPGFYYYSNSDSKWIGLVKSSNIPRFFYMPSILIDTSTLGQKTLDLYTLYNNQFNAPKVSSTGSTGRIPVLQSNQLEYYVTYFDNTLMNGITINASGVMTYNVIGNASDASFMNIVFVVK